MKTPDLNPCPFCGNREPMYRDELVKEYNSWINAEYVVCTKCGCRTSLYTYDGQAAARRAWNRRANDEGND